MVPVRSAGVDSHLSSPTTPTSLSDAEHESDRESSATTVPETVMAEQVTNDVVKEAQSVGQPAPIDDTASTTNSAAASAELPSGPTATSTTSTPSAPPPPPLAASADPAQPDGAPPPDQAERDAATTPGEQKPSAAAQKDASEAQLNGDSAEQSAEESQQVPGDVSVGSDTDISRPGSVDPSKEAAGYVRASKKPSTFKSVNVTKAFLAKSAVSTPVARPGDKAAPAVQPSASLLQTARPRLVAKSGSANAPRALGKMNGAGSGPDASKVWNKNQPVPPPPPKQFTDEELKQQYGIHLATRLQADEAGKEAKWADIDDDEDDWAPDTVEWMDGTKSSVAVPDAQPPPPEEPKPKPAAKAEAPVEAPKPAPTTSTNAHKPSVTGGTKTILKPGAHTQPTTGKTSLVLKGQPEKPSLIAKPSASEKKSPWATLPPVEKVSPIQINPPQQQQQPSQQRFSQQDSRGYDHMPPPPAKEIAPDDFTRRDDRSNRELFNSHNGRYEPVHEMRRSSARDANFRHQPSVLQRPSHDSPAEPSSAFQTSRASADMPSWGRRRNSSNVSGGNGRRMSIDRRTFDLPNGSTPIERRTSHSINGGDTTGSGAPRQLPVQAVSPNIANAHPASPYPSVVSPAAQDVPPPSAPVPMEDPVEVQKRLMAEKRERARLKKQQEQEAEKKAEAERKERLAKKLAALEPVVEAKSKAKEPSPARAPEESPQKEKAVPASVQSPPKPPVPTLEGEVAQYGMMKVHQAQPVRKTQPNDPSPPTKPVVPSPPFDTFARDRDNASRQQTEQPQSQTRQSEGAIPQGPKATQAQQAAWTPATAPQPRPWTSQVWGPLQTKERALGNGTFNSPFSQGQPRTGAQQQLPSQPSSAPAAPISLNTATHPSTLQPTNQAYAAKPMYPQSTPLPAQAAAPTMPGPIAPPPAAAKGWGDFLTHIRNDDATMAQKARQDFDRLGGETFRPEIRETYKDQNGKAETTLHDKVGGKAAPFEAGNNSGSPAAVAELKPREEVNKPVHEVSSPQQNLSQVTPLQQTAGSRSSRFFPRPADTAPQAATNALNKTSSPPPPPETESHPAFSGDMHHPLVRLPKPSPRVRLPPQAVEHVAPVEAPVSMPPRGQPGIGSRPLAMNPEWQARFNQLLQKPGSVPVPVPVVKPVVATPSVISSKPNSLAVAALSKATLDVRGNAGSATVSLPNAPPRRNVDTCSKETITRNGTEALFEDREFGSLPTVKLSKVPHLAANKAAVGAPRDKDDPRLMYKKWENPFTTRRLEAFDTEKGTPKVEVTIHLSTTRDPVIKQMLKKYRGGMRSNAQYKPQRNNIPNGSPTSVPKDRSRKPLQQSQGANSKSSPRALAASTWSTNNRQTPPPPPPPQQQQPKTWARLAASAASVH